MDIRSVTAAVRTWPLSLGQKGALPNFSKLAADGCYRRLRTTYPSISPVAWSSFSTGSEPAS